MVEKLKGLLERINMQMVKIYLAVIVGGSALVGFVMQLIITNMGAFLSDDPFRFNLGLICVRERGRPGSL